jgi:predicted transcriptional regulator of viral defense system
MDKRDKLFEIANTQQGYFTAHQAQICGFKRPHFQRYLVSGEWEKEIRGIYRLARYPLAERPDLVVWYLWSSDRKGNPQGVWSHETALDFYDISDIMPSKLFMTVPTNFQRRRNLIPPHLTIYHANLRPEEVREHAGFKMTSLPRTFIDLVHGEQCEPSLLGDAFLAALDKGMISPSELAQLKTTDPKMHFFIQQMGIL